MKRASLAAVILFATAGVAGAQANPISVIGSLSGFDVANRGARACDSFEVRLTGVSAADVFHAYRNKDFDAPSVSEDGPDTVVEYRNHSTDPGSIEHFGVSLAARPSAVRYRWRDKGRDCAGSGSSADVPLPSEDQNLSGDTLTTDLRNDSPDPVWIQRREQNDNRAVALEELRTDNPSYTDGSEIDTSPERLEPGATVTRDDSVDPEDKVESLIEATDVYADDNGKPGALIGTVIHAAIVNPSGAAACVDNLASLKLNPNQGKGGAVRPTGVVRLSSAAPTGGEIVLLTSDTPAAASVPTIVKVKAGAKAASFRVVTHPVPEAETVDIKATCGSIDREAQLLLRK